MACAAALTVLDVILRDKLCEHVARHGIVLKEKLLQALGEHPNVRGIRGKGFMLGIELDRPANELKMIGLTHGILLNITAESVIRILPPLIISEKEIDQLVEKLVKSVNEFVGK